MSKKQPSDSSAKSSGKNSARLSSSFSALASCLKRSFPSSGINLGFLKDISQKDLKQKLGAPISNLHEAVQLDTVSVAASLFMARKVLPVPGTKGEAEGKLFQKLTQPGPKAAGEDWLRCAGEVVGKLFPEDWDSSYETFVEESLRVNPSAGLKRQVSARKEVEERFEWVEWSARIAKGDLTPISEIRKIVAVEDGGKWRTVTVGDAMQAQLRPLHTMMYEHLSKHRWLLRGEPVDKEIAKMLAGEEPDLKGSDVYVSGDYEAATDNFCPWNSLRILALVFSRSRNIPGGVMEAAYRSVLGGRLRTQGMNGPRVTGQLMGDYLSFPLLCLTNFVGFIFGCGSEVGWRIANEGFLLINGDDIVFRSPRESAERWMESVVDAGLVLSRGKTLIHKRVFSVNSTFFMGSSRVNSGEVRRHWHVRTVPIVRLKTWVKPGSNGLQGRVERICHDAGPKRRVILESFYAHIWKRVQRGGLPVGLGRVLAGVGVKEGIVPKGWKERVRWFVDHQSLFSEELPNERSHAESQLKFLFQRINFPKGRTLTGKYAHQQKAEAYGRAMLSWGLEGLHRVYDEPGDQGWGHVIPQPFVKTFSYLKFGNKKMGVHAKTGGPFKPRAGLGAKVEMVVEAGWFS